MRTRKYASSSPRATCKEADFVDPDKSAIHDSHIDTSYADSGEGLIYGDQGNDSITIHGGGNDTVYGGQGDKVVAFKGFPKMGLALAAAKLLAGREANKIEYGVTHTVEESDSILGLKEMRVEIPPLVGSAIGHFGSLSNAELARMSLLGPKPDVLTIHGVYILGIGAWYAHLGRPFNYTNVQTGTDELHGKAMVTAMIYKTIENLKERGFLIDKGRMTDPQSGRPVSYYEISDAGRAALKGAVLNSCILENLQVDAA